MKKAKWLLMLPALALAAVSLSTPSQGYAEGSCNGRYSWLVPSACTYCQTSTNCGECQIKGCIPGSRM